MNREELLNEYKKIIDVHLNIGVPDYIVDRVILFYHSLYNAISFLDEDALYMKKNRQYREDDILQILEEYCSINKTKYSFVIYKNWLVNTKEGEKKLHEMVDDYICTADLYTADNETLGPIIKEFIDNFNN